MDENIICGENLVFGEDIIFGNIVFSDYIIFGENMGFCENMVFDFCLLFLSVEGLLSTGPTPSSFQNMLAINAFIKLAFLFFSRLVRKFGSNCKFPKKNWSLKLGHEFTCCSNYL